MKLYVCHRPRAVVLARDENHARLLLAARLSERGVHTRPLKPVLVPVDQSHARVIMPPPGEPYAEA